MQNFVLVQDKLSPEFVVFHLENIINTTDPQLLGIINEVNKDIATAKKAAKRPPLNNKNYNLNSSFINKLADKKSKDECCHEILPLPGCIILNALFAQQNTNCCAPLWDSESIMLPAPRRIANYTALKISPAALRLTTELSTKTKKVFGEALSPVIPKDIIDLDKRLIRRGQGLGAVAHGAYCITDPFPYFQTKVNVDKIAKPVKDALTDCLFNIILSKITYNALNIESNQATATNPGYTITSGGCSFKVDWLGKQIRPLKKAKDQSIKSYLDFKESMYSWSDYSNWNLYPTTGDESKERSIVDVMIEKKLIKN